MSEYHRMDSCRIIEILELERKNQLQVQKASVDKLLFDRQMKRINSASGAISIYCQVMTSAIIAGEAI